MKDERRNSNFSLLRSSFFFVCLLLSSFFYLFFLMSLMLNSIHDCIDLNGQILSLVYSMDLICLFILGFLGCSCVWPRDATPCSQYVIQELYLVCLSFIQVLWLWTPDMWPHSVMNSGVWPLSLVCVGV